MPARTKSGVGRKPLKLSARTKQVRPKRDAAEFNPTKLRAAFASPVGGLPLTSWTLEEIFNARDAQMRGEFRLPARMAESMRTDDALAPALENRLAPSRCIPVEIVASKKSPKSEGKKIAGEASALYGQKGVAITPDTIASVHACLVTHDVAFACNTQTIRDDGARTDLEMRS
jgi:hypothetical protein